MSTVPGSLTLIRLADPTSPSLVARSSWQLWTNPESPVGGLGVAAWSGRAVIADGSFGVRVLDPSLCRRPNPGPSAPVAGVD